jgi:lipoic acid synthetase
MQHSTHFPKWLRRKLPKGRNFFYTDATIKKYGLHTVCEEANCPNRFECFGKKTATFLVLGKECTRNCGFCDIAFSKQPKPPSKEEPKQIAYAVKELGLRHVVITMVTRDDLLDQGATHLTQIIREIRIENPSVSIEMLTSDFGGKKRAIDLLLTEPFDIFNHNIETVRRLTPRIRHKATYDQSLSVLSYVKSKKEHPLIKSGMMVGLGETEEEVFEAIRDLYDIGCDIITIGQYLQPNAKKLRVQSFITPKQFAQYEQYGLRIGIKQLYCGPFVRSSYEAARFKSLVRDTQNTSKVGVWAT